jgi:hypothetical protein
MVTARICGSLFDVRLSRLLAPLLACACSAPAPEEPGAPTARLVWARSGDGAFEIRLDGRALGELRPEGAGWRLRGDATRVRLSVEETALTPAHPYPRRVRIEGRRDEAGIGFRHEYTLLAPAAPLPIEGFGLVVTSDEPGINEAEHEALRAWLAAQGLPADTRPFQALHEQETGRELRVWYEISGRRVDGSFARIGAADPAARIDSLFRSEAGGLKLHHQRPGENGRFTYHRQSLELADRIAAAGQAELAAHECGCYGYAIAADFTTLGSALYHVEADWLDDRVGAEFFVGFERREEFPWLGIGDRRRLRDLARRAKAYRLKDARGESFAEVALDLPADPPPPGLGPIGYRIDRFGAGDVRQPLARIEHEANRITVALFGPEAWESALEALDRLLAAMPVQVMRGDGVRDSQLGEIERLVDAVRLLRAPDESRLADFVSDVDASSAAGKVGALLAPEAERFQAAADGLPPAPIPGPGGATRHARGR